MKEDDSVKQDSFNFLAPWEDYDRWYRRFYFCHLEHYTFVSLLTQKSWWHNFSDINWKFCMHFLGETWFCSDAGILVSFLTFYCHPSPRPEDISNGMPILSKRLLWSVRKRTSTEKYEQKWYPKSESFIIIIVESKLVQMTKYYSYERQVALPLLLFPIRKEV